MNAEIAGALAASGVPGERLSVLTPYSPTVLEARDPPAALADFRAAHAPLLAAALPPGAVYGADLLLPAFAALRARLPRAGLLVFGAGTEALGVAGLLGLGEVAHATALAVLEAADVFVRPTRADGDAVTIREALALGCGVVASDVGHRPSGCLLFPSGDLAALTDRLVEAARAGRPGARPVAGEDPFEAIIAMYRMLWAEAGPGRNGALGVPR